MIRLIDAMTLAYTKLRTHKIRTGLTIGVAGILFGLILAVIMVAQGVFVYQSDAVSFRCRPHVSFRYGNSRSPFSRKCFAEVRSDIVVI